MGSILVRALVVVTAAATCLLVAVPSGFARDGKDDRPEVRATGICSGSATAKLKVRANSGALELEFELEHARSGVLWRIAFVHERRVVWKGSASTTRPYGSLAIRRALPDLPGYDTVTARAWGPAGLACRVTATLAGS